MTSMMRYWDVRRSGLIGEEKTARPTHAHHSLFYEILDADTVRISRLVLSEVGE